LCVGGAPPRTGKADQYQKKRISVDKSSTTRNSSGEIGWQREEVEKWARSKQQQSERNENQTKVRAGRPIDHKGVSKKKAEGRTQSRSLNKKRGPIKKGGPSSGGGRAEHGRGRAKVMTTRRKKQCHP